MVYHSVIEDEVYKILTEHSIDAYYYDDKAFAAVDKFLSASFRRGYSYQYEVITNADGETGYASVSWCVGDRAYMVNWKFLVGDC